MVHDLYRSALKAQKILYIEVLSSAAAIGLFILAHSGT